MDALTEYQIRLMRLDCPACHGYREYLKSFMIHKIDRIYGSNDLDTKFRYFLLSAYLMNKISIDDMRALAFGRLFIRLRLFGERKNSYYNMYGSNIDKFYQDSIDDLMPLVRSYFED